MNISEAEAIIGNVWTRTYPADGRLDEALRLAEIDPVEFKRLMSATRRVEVRQPRCVILTPTGTRR